MKLSAWADVDPAAAVKPASVKQKPNQETFVYVRRTASCLGGAQTVCRVPP